MPIERIFGLSILEPVSDIITGSMRKTGQRHPESDRHVVCPFCQTACDTSSSVRWCSGCGVEWSIGPAGDAIFDSERQADRQTLAEAARAETAGTARGLEGAARRRPRRLGKKRRS